MNIYIQVGIISESLNLRHGLDGIRNIYEQAKGYLVVYFDRFGKRITRQWAKFENDKNWPVGSSKMIISQSGATARHLKPWEIRTLVHISPLDENWAPSEQCLRTTKESQVGDTRSVIETFIKSKPSIRWWRRR